MRVGSATAQHGVKYVYDELHGYIPLNDVELRVIDTPTFQRLRRVKQLAQAWYVYPGAVHTRFSHSLGVMKVMDTIATKLSSEGLVRRDDVELLKLAALLHDIGHTPYSHALEQYFMSSYGLRHEEISRWVIEEDPYISGVLKEHGYEPREVAAVVLGLHREVTYNSLLSSDLDVDRLDYLMRDALHTGVAYGLIDLDRIVHTVTVDRDGYVAIPPKSVQAVESFYVARLHMYRAVYYHKTITGYQLLLSNIYSLMASDPAVKGFVEPFTTPEGIRKAIRSGSFYLWDDFYVGGLLNYVVSKGLGGELTRSLIRLYLNRSGYRAVYEWVGFGDEPVPEGVRDRVRDFVEEVGRRGLGKYVIAPFIEVITIVSEDEVVRVITDGSSVKITGYRGSVASTLPSAMGIVRVYALQPYVGVAEELASKLLYHDVGV